MKKLLWIFVMFVGVNVFAQTKPVLSNFRIENSNKDRVYFDVSGDISGLTKQGFVISGKTISSINTTGNYFTVSSAFNFWDNNTIRLGENSDASDVNPLMHNFTLSYIKNNIYEPEANIDRYVTTFAHGGGDGKSEATAWTIYEAASNASSGMTIWIKAGDYGDITNWVLSKSGTKSNPIKYIGYKSVPGDITLNYFDYGIEMDSKKMPTFSGSSTLYVHKAIYIRSEYVLLKNIQTRHYGASIINAGSTVKNFIFENINIKDNYHSSDANSTGISFYRGEIKNLRFINIVVVNASMSSIAIQSDNNLGFSLFDNVKSYNDKTSKPERNDYHIAFNGNDNIIRNSFAENHNNTEGNGSTHGIGIRGGTKKQNNYNLIESSIVINTQEGFYIRNYGCNYNVIKDCVVDNNGAHSVEDRGGVWLWGGVNYNIIERISVNDVDFAIGLKDNESEDGITDASVGDGNIIRNSVFSNTKYAVYAYSQLDNANFDSNKILNCTFNNIQRFFDTPYGHVKFKNFKFVNNIFYSVGRGDNLPSGFSFDHNNFYNSWTSSLGTNFMNVDPKFENASGGNFKLKSDSPLIDKGKNLNEVPYDFDGNHRPQGASIDMGAFEYQDTTTTSVNANAGVDQTICLGESVTLTASGGSTYSWSNGETTKSITVHPNTTATYTVTVSEGSASDTDSVQVTVNSVTAGAGGNQTITAGDSVTLTASGGDSYVWNTGATTQSITVTPTATTTYTVTAKKGECEDTDTVQVTVNASATVTANAGSDQSICLGESVTLTANGGSTYSWNTGATTKSITVNPNTTTTYTVTVTEGSDSDSDSVEVTVNSVTAGAGGNQTITAGDSVTLTASGGDSYVWNTGATTQSITVTPTATTSYTVTAKKGDCEDTDTVTVTVNAAATVTANAGVDQTICLGESVTLTANGGSTYSWNTGATTKSITVNPNTTTTYTVTVTEGSASDSDSVTVSVSSVTAYAGSDKTITQGENVTLTASGGDSYVWNTGATTQSITVSPIATTTYTVTAKKGDCEDTDTVLVTVNAAAIVTANAGVDQTICLGESVTLTANGGSTYSWNTGATTKSITVNPNTTTTYTVTVSEGSASDSDSVQVTVNNITANAGADKTIYEGESITLTASGGDSYLWSTGAKSKSITVSPQETQNYTVTAKKGDCEDTDTVQVTVNKKDTSPPPAKANAGEDQTICLGESVTLTATGGKTYSWSTGETTKAIQVNPTRTTSYTVTATRGGVTNSDAVVVTVENCSAISDTNKQEEMSVYPNPTTGTLNIKAANDYSSLHLNIYSMNGSIVYSDVVQTHNNVAYKTVDISNLSKGVYVVRMYNSDYHKTKRVLLY